LIVPVDTHSHSDYATEIEKAFLEHHEMVYRAAFRITGNASDAEDVLQTLFMRLMRREWTPDREFGWPAYLHRAAVNIAVDIIRSRARDAVLEDGDVRFQEPRPDPHHAYSAIELRKSFAAGLADLSPSWAEIFVLRYVEGYKVHEIAQMLDCSKGTVAVTLFRTRNRLRKSMRKFLGGR
jgi:RNA polymerase sigma-70 factor (ECF subfamily)